MTTKSHNIRNAVITVAVMLAAVVVFWSILTVVVVIAIVAVATVCAAAAGFAVASARQTRPLPARPARRVVYERLQIDDDSTGAVRQVLADIRGELET